MPIDLTKVPERLTEAVATGNLVPFVGAGVSRQAKTGTPDAFPTWTELLSRLQNVAPKGATSLRRKRARFRTL
jgi:hypothetical protein